MTKREEVATETKRAENPRKSKIGYVYDGTFGLLVAQFKRRIIQPIFSVNDSPRSVAKGVALGIWVALTPTVGVQMIVVVLLGTVLKANRIVAVALTWISNILTMVPLYYAYYVTGLVLMGREGIEYAELESLMAESDRSSWDTMIYLLDHLGAPLWIGSLTIATVVALPLYPICLRALDRRAAMKSQSSEISEVQDRPNVEDDQ